MTVREWYRVQRGALWQHAVRPSAQDYVQLADLIHRSHNIRRDFVDRDEGPLLRTFTAAATAEALSAPDQAAALCTKMIAYATGWKSHRDRILERLGKKLSE